MEKTTIKTAIKLINEYNMASISLLQRKMDIGYDQAKIVMDELEREGIVSELKGTGREILTKKKINNDYT